MSDGTPEPLPPLRPVFDRLGPGRLGVVAARAGVGKSTFLVRVALDDIFRGSQVLHVSLRTPVAHVRAAYEAKLDALRARHPEAVTAALRLEVERRRMIHSYLGGAFSASRLEDALGFLAEHVDFRPGTIVVDGFAGAEPGLGEVDSLAEVATRVGAALWLSARIERDEPADAGAAMPASLAPVAGRLHLVVRLEPEGGTIRVRLLREETRAEPRLLPLRLDPTTMLFVEEDQARARP